MKYFKPYLKLPRTIYILFLSITINSIGSFVYPLLAILLTLKLGLSEDIAGRITTLTVIVGSVGLLLGGRLSDKFGRKKIIIIGGLVAAASFITCAFLGASKIIIVFLILGNFFSLMQFPAINAMIIDKTNKQNRQNAFSLLYLGTNIGIAIGPLMAGFLITRFLFLFFIIDALTIILSIIPIIFFIKDTLPTEYEKKSIKKTDTESAEKGNILKIFLRRPLIVVFMFLSILYFIIFSQYAFSVPLFVNHVFGINGPKNYGLLMTVNAITIILFTIFIVSFTSKKKPIINISIAGILLAIGFGMLYYSETLYLFIVSTLIWTIGEILLTINMSVFIANNSPITHRARFNAIANFIPRLGLALAPLITGELIIKIGIINIWPVVFITAIVASIAMLSLYFLEKKFSKKN